MYFVDRSQMRQTLAYIDRLLEELDQHSFETSIEKIGLERITHMVIESILDVGNMMIDGFIMRDPGSYEDIIDILIDEKVLPQQDEQPYKAVIQLRKSIVQDYLNIDHQEIKATMMAHKETLKSYSLHIQTYLDDELGVAHAFSNE
ncbi:MAG TPA: DUF86 domain-containing protein [Virgibacillus sp.]|nr:DUF86 domain-containing protein [Virgibacillus sp.]